MKEVINKLDYINFENICSENDNLHRISFLIKDYYTGFQSLLQNQQ